MSLEKEGIGLVLVSVLTISVRLVNHGEISVDELQQRLTTCPHGCVRNVDVDAESGSSSRNGLLNKKLVLRRLGMRFPMLTWQRRIDA